jgi:hypothetical protein
VIEAAESLAAALLNPTLPVALHPDIDSLSGLQERFALCGHPARFPQERADAELPRPGALRPAEWVPPADEE